MKRIFLIIFLLFIISGNAYALTPEQYYAKAYGNMVKNNTGEAKKLFEKAISEFPDKGFLYAGMGDTYLKEKNYAKALDLYTKAQKKDLKNPTYKINYYDCLIQKIKNEIDTTKRELIKSTKFGNNEIVYKNIEYLMQEKFSSLEFALEVFNEADIVSNAGDDYKKLNNAGVQYIREKNYTEAEKYLIKALALNDKSPYIWNNLGVTSFYLKNYKKADEYFKNAQNLDKASQTITNNIAVNDLLSALNSYTSVNINTMKTILSENPSNNYARKVLADMYYYQNDYKNAELMINPLVVEYNPNIFYEKALISYKNGNYTKAYQDIERAIKLSSDVTNFHVLRARILTSQKNYTEAKRSFSMINRRDFSADKYYYQALVSYLSSNREEAVALLQRFWNGYGGYLTLQNIQILFE